MRVLILGATGMLGHMLLAYFRSQPGFTVTGTQVLDPDQPFYFNAEKSMNDLQRLYAEANGFDYCINAIGLTANRIQLSQPASVLRAIRLNAGFPHQLAALAEALDMRVIHISTDGVFSGALNICDEASPADCTDVYGQTKHLGEVQGSSAVLNLRCSIIGPSPLEGSGLWEWFFAQPAGEKLYGYTNQLWSGVTTLQFAQLCRRLMPGPVFDALRQVSPVYHFAPNPVLTKYQLLEQFRQISPLNIAVEPMPAAAEIRRELTTRYQAFRALWPERREWPAPLQEMLAFMQTEAYQKTMKGVVDNE